MEHDILTISEVAVYLRIKENTAYRLAGEGKLQAFKVDSVARGASGAPKASNG